MKGAFPYPVAVASAPAPAVAMDKLYKPFFLT
jgi:hypothetical protein